MLDAVKRYAAGILLLHLVLLVIVILVVLWASRQVQTSGAGAGAGERQETAGTAGGSDVLAGIESQYSSILDNLDVVLRGTSTATSSAPAVAIATQATTMGARAGQFARGGGGGQGGRGNAGGRGGALRPRIDLNQPVNAEC